AAPRSAPRGPSRRETRSLGPLRTRRRPCAVPELPEVETARRSLHRAVVGRTIARVAVLRPAAVRSHTADGFARALRGAAITDVLRRGKALWFVLDHRVLVFHYMLWGVIRHRPAAAGGGVRAAGSPGANAAASPGARVVLYLDDGPPLEFRDLPLRRFALLRPGAMDAVEPEAVPAVGLRPGRAGVPGLRRQDPGRPPRRPAHVFLSVLPAVARWPRPGRCPSTPRRCWISSRRSSPFPPSIRRSDPAARARERSPAASPARAG